MDDEQFHAILETLSRVELLLEQLVAAQKDTLAQVKNVVGNTALMD